ncbi:MAG: hypothetical protein DRP08_00015 [Candidatus Aenigmatarchaeota archaeon]|nr:MAG: hypothetical protein DRP08_00015 [Candidatus Aenigmarchaeota archaeon]
MKDFKKITIEELGKVLEEAWCKETSSDPENWTPENPAYGQCAVTALVVQDYFGGKIVHADVIVNGKSVSHYFNKINNEEIDFTRKQFPSEAIIPSGKVYKRTRDYILSYPDTIKRYEILKERVDFEINSSS